MEEDVIANTRELEVLLNGIDTDNKALRARLAAYRTGISKEYHNNHIRDAITKLAKFGIYVRDREDEIINHTLGILSNNKKYSPIGEKKYKDGGIAGIGLGKEKLLDFGMGRDIEQLLRKILEEKEEINALRKSWNGRKFISFDIIYNALKSAKQDRFTSASENYSYWEWINTNNEKKIPKNIKDWKFYDMKTILLSLFGKDTCLNMTTDEISHNCKQIMKIDPQKCIDWSKQSHPLPINDHGKIIMDFIENDSPLLISTDDSHIPGKAQLPNHTSASMVLCKLDITNNECLEDTAWTDRPVIPLLARAAQLPTAFGTSQSDIAHGECAGILLQEETFSGTLPRIVLMDSSAIRKCAMNIRDISDTNNTNRKYIRHVTSGVGKYLAGRLLTAFKNNRAETKDTNNKHFYKIDALTKLLQLKLQRYNKIARTWCIGSSNDPTPEDTEKHWPIEYWDDHNLRPIHKVNSHQLNHNGTCINPSPRYPQLIPNLATLSSNHHADIAATTFASNKKTRDFLLPTSNLRFFVTWKGRTIDKGVAKTLLHIFQLEKTKRMQSKATQGLLWRLQEHSDTKWKKLLQHPGWLRSLLGLSNTHTRALYKSNIYRSGAWITYCKKAQQNETGSGVKEKEKIKILSPCMWCNNQSDCQQSRNQPMTIKENRLHHFFFCKHKHILKIRNDMDTILEDTFRKMLECYTALHGDISTRRLLLAVEETFLKLQTSNTGRLRNLPDHINPYRSLESWRKHLKTASWEQAYSEGKLKLIDIFNCRPHFSDSSMSDEFLGTAEGMFLGLIPRSLNNLMTDKLQSEHVNVSMPRQLILTCQSQQTKAWDEIKELLIAKSVSLHRILNQTTSLQTTTWKTQYELQESSFRDYKECIKSNKNSTIITTNTAQQPSTQIQTATTMHSNNTRYCTGITCNKKTHMWNTSRCNNASKLNHKKTQCQRCSKHLTAMKKGASFLHNLSSPKSKINVDETIKLFSSQDIHSPAYKPLMNMLHETSSKAQHDEAK